MLKTIGFLAIVAAIIMVLGLFLGWFSFSKESQGTGSAKATGITFNVNEGKIKGDAEKVKQKTGDLVDQAKDAVTKDVLVEGTLTTNESALRRLVLKQDDAESVTVTVKDGAKIELNGNPAGLIDLKFSDRIVARCDSAGDGSVATSITATRR